MDQGIIQATKLKFRKRQLSHMVKEMDRQPTVSGPELLKQLNLLDAIYWISNSWAEVEESTIVKCFLKAGFVSKKDSECDSAAYETSEDEDKHDDVPLAVFKMSRDLFGCSFDELLKIDHSLQTCDTNAIDWDRPAQELLSEFNNDCDSDDNDDEDPDSEVQVPVPTLYQANESVNKLKAFALHSGRSDILNIVSQLDDLLCTLTTDDSIQTKITEFFVCDRPT